MNINKMAKKSYETSVNHGFWDNGNDTIPLKLMLIVSELAEAMEAYRTDTNYHEVVVDGKPEGLIVELADAVIRIGDLAEGFNLNLEQAILNKMKYNKTRPFMHGGKKA